MDKTPSAILEVVTNRILSVKKNGPILVAVNGKDASGKTIFSGQLVGYLRSVTDRPVIQVSFDGFLNEASIRNAPFESEGRGSYEYAFNYQGFLKHFLLPLSSTPPKYVEAIYDVHKDEVLTNKPIEANTSSIFIIDGLFLFRQDMVGYWDYKILLQADEAVILDRGPKRDAEIFGGLESARQRYTERYLPSQEVYYGEVNPSRLADVIIENSNPAQAYLVS